MFEVTYNDITLQCQSTALPDLYSEYRKHATLGEEFDLAGREEGQWCYVGVKKDSGWPFLTVAQRFWPSGAGFHPGALLVPETLLLFIGAGERLLAYDLRVPKRLWLDAADTGFWHWDRYGGFVLMAAELEFAAWNTEGLKLWSTFVEPPWEYQVVGDSVILDVMGKKSTFDLQHGPQNKTV
jgi:hypothetical protein